jgi:hypothetical protein
MDIQLDSDQREEMLERADDVVRLAGMMSSGGRYVSPEEAYLAWRRNSDSSAAGWLSFDESSQDEVSSAFTGYVLDAIRADAGAHFERIQDDVIDFVRDYLDASPGDAEKEDVLTVKTKDSGVVLGRMEKWSSNDQGIVEAIAERFDYEISPHAVMFERHVLLEPMGLAIVDAEGDDA